MNKLHEKSPCCRGRIRRFGKRRRQCVICKKTWRAWQKKRGRKKARVSAAFLIRYLEHQTPSLRGLAKRYNLSEAVLKYRLKRSRQKFVSKTPWPSLPQRQSLIAIADAMVRYTKKGWHTFYFVLLRPARGDRAIIVKPYIKKGTETYLGWSEALDRLPEKTRSSIVALVCDGHGGLVNYARQYGWLIQRCHFHLIARLQSRRSKWRTGRHQKEGKRIYDLVNKVLAGKNKKVILKALVELEEIGWLSSSPEIARTLSGFVKHYEDYRTYLRYPELNLPRTSNTAESLIGCVQKLCQRTRGFASLDSLREWIEALIKYKKIIKCNGMKNQPNKNT